MKKLTLTKQIMIATVIGMVVGLLVGPSIAPIKVIGDIFLRLIQMSVIIIVMGAVIEAVGQLDPKDLGKLGFKIFGWFMFSTIIAASIGVMLGYMIHPGLGIPKIAVAENMIKANNQSIQDMIVNFFPTNVISSMANAQMIQVIVFSILFGIAISRLVSRQGDTQVLNIVRSFNKTILEMVKMIMNIAPLGIFAMLAWVTGTIGLHAMIPLFKFLSCMAIGTVFILVSYIAFLSFYVKVNPIKLASKFANMTLVAFTTSSSAITLPTQMADSENKLGISKRISNLVNPLGMALNSSGLSLYLALACVTLAQMFGIEITFVKLMQIIVISTLACLGTVVVPGGGLVTLATVVPVMGFPIEGIAILAGIDWFSGMFRAVLNVDVDAMVAMIIAKDEDEFDRKIFNNT